MEKCFYDFEEAHLAAKALRSSCRSGTKLSKDQVETLDALPPRSGTRDRSTTSTSPTPGGRDLLREEPRAGPLRPVEREILRRPHAGASQFGIRRRQFHHPRLQGRQDALRDRGAGDGEGVPGRHWSQETGQKKGQITADNLASGRPAGGRDPQQPKLSRLPSHGRRKSVFSTP